MVLEFSVWISYTSEAKITDLQIAVCVQKQIRRLQVSMNHIRTEWKVPEDTRIRAFCKPVNIFEATEDLIEEIADVFI